MEEKRLNRKVLYTRKVIKESFLELVKEKDYSKITVRELTEMADINRATFYAHYDNIDDLCRDIEKDMASQVIRSMDILYSCPDYKENMIAVLFDAFNRNKEMCVWFMDDHSTGYGVELIYEYAKEKCIPKWMKEGNLSKAEAERFLNFIYSGATSYLKEWYRSENGMDSEKTKTEFNAMITCSLQYVYGHIKRK